MVDQLETRTSDRSSFGTDDFDPDGIGILVRAGNESNKLWRSGRKLAAVALVAGVAALILVLRSQGDPATEQAVAEAQSAAAQPRSPHAAAGAPATPIQAVNVRDRAGDGAGSVILSVIAPPQRVTVVRCAEPIRADFAVEGTLGRRWCQIRFAGGDGWVYGTFLRRT